MVGQGKSLEWVLERKVPRKPAPKVAGKVVHGVYGLLCTVRWGGGDVAQPDPISMARISHPHLRFRLDT